MLLYQLTSNREKLSSLLRDRIRRPLQTGAKLHDHTRPTYTYTDVDAKKMTQPSCLVYNFQTRYTYIILQQHRGGGSRKAARREWNLAAVVIREQQQLETVN